MVKVLVPLAIRKDQSDYHFPIHFIRSSYLNKLKRYRLMPFFVTTFMTPTMIKEAMSQASGLFLTGGADIDPALYQTTPHHKTKAHEKERDKLEIFLVKQAVKEKKPTLGICRGVQLMNVALGGTLVQHLPEAVPNENHGSKSYQALKTNQTHSVKISTKSRLYQTVGKKQIQVKSHHHQAVKKLGKDLKAVGFSPAGVVEAVEFLDPDFFFLGVQSHPETQDWGDLEAIFAEFAQAVKKYQKQSK